MLSTVYKKRLGTSEINIVELEDVDTSGILVNLSLSTLHLYPSSRTLLSQLPMSLNIVNSVLSEESLKVSARGAMPMVYSAYGGCFEMSFEFLRIFRVGGSSRDAREFRQSGGIRVKKAVAEKIPEG